jgi:acetyl-CoA acetyltransferase
MCVGTCKVLGIDDERVNVLGSGCSLGHPIAMTGARMVMTLVHELRRRGGGTGVSRAYVTRAAAFVDRDSCSTSCAGRPYTTEPTTTHHHKRVD